MSGPERATRLAAAVSLASLLSTLAACGTSSDEADGGKTGATTLTVYAASSLKGAFEDIAGKFEAEHSGVTVSLSFAGSSDLVAQIEQGAPADVFASADTTNMSTLADDDLLASAPREFATNTLMIAVPPDNPANIARFGDLARKGVDLVVCAPQVPCGSAATKAAAAAGVTLAPVSEEQSVADVLAKVVAGEADAGLVYVTDVKAAGADVRGIAFPESSSAVNTYPIAVLGDAEDPALAQQFTDVVLGPVGQSILAEAGFASP